MPHFESWKVEIKYLQKKTIDSMCPVSFSYDPVNLQIQLTRDRSPSSEDENILIDSITVESPPQFGTRGD